MKLFWLAFICGPLLTAATIDSGSVVHGGTFLATAVTNIASSGGGYSVSNVSNVAVTTTCAPCMVGDTISWLRLYNGFEQVYGSFTVGGVTQLAQFGATAADLFAARFSNYELTAAPFSVTGAAQQTTTFTMVGSLYGTIPTGLNSYIDVLTDPNVTGHGIVYMNFRPYGNGLMELYSANWVFVPEPATWATLPVALAGLAWMRRKRGAERCGR